MFSADAAPDSFIKYAVAQYIKKATPKLNKILEDDDQSEQEEIYKEIDAMQKIKPHAILTTNYDSFLEQIFPDYKVIVGQGALRGMSFAVGEIFKFHGCVSEPNEIVLTTEDYNTFSKKKKFIAARML